MPAASAAEPRRDRRPDAAASDAPMSSEMAEVTVTAVCRELQNSQKTSPPNKHA